MQFVVSKQNLQKELGFVQGVVEKKNTIPVLSNILIESVGENTIRITGTDLDVTIRLAQRIPSDRLIVSESGIQHRADVERLVNAGVQAMLVGESLIRAERIEEKLRELLGVSIAPAQAG